MKNIAVVLLNLGGPDGPDAVKPFLFNLFHDPAIIRLPQPLRFLIAKLISGKRASVAREIYAKIGGGSPILKNTQAQAQALEEKLNNSNRSQTFKCFIAMRYWFPFTGETVQQVKTFAPDEIVLLPLYPQFSTTTTGSSLKKWQRDARKAGLDTPTKTICCYPTDTGFINALAASARQAHVDAVPHGKPRILFSAHGLPEKIVKSGDPYQFQCEQTAKALVAAIDISDLDWILCYQSRVGPLKWIGPSTDEEIRRAGYDRVPIIVVPMAFVSEHSETLVEIDMEYRHMAKEVGVPYFSCVPTVGIAPEFINGLAGLVGHAMGQRKNCPSAVGERMCPAAFSGCPCK